ncbi:hypothetical protein KAF25_000343 [Fusarium avenaceum]|uniref:Uncharacterized protein n=1 Tax=Fusarium avenaceum TaxID=40199 RepID=A0A9P7KMY9_9HYPO|nr:hypothetical protein KAF25_000343 [Fusarium avenaceum]
MDRYLQAVRALRETIKTKKKNSDVQTLYGILLLCGYETGTGQSCIPSAWGNHVDGALALMKLNEISLDTPLSQGIFSFLQKNMVIKQMQICQPLDTVFSQGITSMCVDPERRLLSLASGIPELQHESIDLEHLQIIEIEKLSHNANALSVKLSTWESTIPTSWHYVTALRINDGASFGYSPCIIHKYRHHYIGRVWNFYRVSQLILQSIRLRAAAFLPAATSHIEIGQTISALVDDICATVPYLLGADLDKMNLDFTENNTRQDPSRRSSSGAKSIGLAEVKGFSLIWPLFVASSVPQIPQAQREWMRKQLHLLAENGVPMAQTVCASESQMLLGRPEMFVFDCV